MVGSVSFLAAVAEGFAVLHAGETALGAGAVASVFGVGLPLAVQEWVSAFSPGPGRAEAITKRLSAWTMACTFAENR